MEQKEIKIRVFTILISLTVITIGCSGEVPPEEVPSELIQKNSCIDTKKLMQWFNDGRAYVAVCDYRCEDGECIPDPGMGGAGGEDGGQGGAYEADPEPVLGGHPTVTNRYCQRSNDGKDVLVSQMSDGTSQLAECAEGCVREGMAHCR